MARVFRSWPSFETWRKKSHLKSVSGEPRAATSDLTEIEVLIVSLCLAERRDAILRALDTIVSQEGVKATPVIVVNGKRYDSDLYRELEARSDVRVIYQEAPSIFLARRLAREHLEAPFFAMLDDDDELLPGALQARLRPMLDDPGLDVVVGNGLLTEGSKQRPILADVPALQRDPLGHLMDYNWLPTASGLFRGRTVTADYFDTSLRTNDMTYLAFRLALEKEVRFVDTPTYLKHYSPDSISLTDAWNRLAADTIEKMLALEMPSNVRQNLRRKYRRTLHNLSDFSLRRGELGPAWGYHVQSLAQPGGLLLYGAYTRHLVAAALTARRHSPA